ncbi:MAG: hypothetical protein KDI39_12415 [Pseudomonadales bacterium]|nr:hypothetical protein [Pseudomonadales bacterium]
MDIFKKTALCVLVSASLIACGGGGGDSTNNNSGGTTGTTYKIENGVFQKGPFIAGTTVTIQELDDNLQATGISYTTTTDAVGRFSMGNVKSRFVEVFANGFYYDELTNKNSVAPITLRSVIDLTTNGSSPSINTLTTLQVEYLRELKKSGKTYQQAQIQSKNAVLSTFGIGDNAIESFNNINLLGSTSADESLLRATVALLQVAREQSDSVEANLTSIISKITTDLKNDGQANEAAKDLVTSLQNAKNTVDTTFIRYRLQKYFGEKTNQPTEQVIGSVSLPKLSEWVSSTTISYENNQKVTYLLRDDGTVWKWILAANEAPKKLTSLSDVVAMQRMANKGSQQTLSLAALTKDGVVFKISQSGITGQIQNVKQIMENMYLDKEGKAHNWIDNGVIGGMPLMERLISHFGKSNNPPWAKGGVGLDGQLYLFKGFSSGGDGVFTHGVVKVGFYPDTQALLYARTLVDSNQTPPNFEEEWVTSILHGNTWTVLDKNGKTIKNLVEPKNTVSTEFGWVNIVAGVAKSSARILDGNGQLWVWNNDNLELTKENKCINVKKMSYSVPFLLNDGTLGQYNVSKEECESVTEESLNNKVIVDLLASRSNVEGGFVAVKSDGGLIAHMATGDTFEASRPN